MRSHLVLVVVGIFVAVYGFALAAQQLVATKTLLVKNPPSGARKVLWKVREAGSAATVVGDPTADGATLRIQLTPGGDQCVTMPSSGWSPVSTIGFKYKDATLANGPVKVAMVKKTPSGTFLLKAILKNGGPASITVVPGGPTTSYATNFTLGVEDQYCGGTNTATPNADDANTFKVSNDGAPSGCIASCNATTTTTSSSTTSTTDVTQCNVSSDCSGTTPICTPTQTCGPCSTNDDCIESTPSTPVCDVSGSCVQCAANSDCSGEPGTSVCNTALGSCVECIIDNDCSDGTPVCDTALGSCVECADNSDCSGTTPVCDTGECVP